MDKRIRNDQWKNDTKLEKELRDHVMKRWSVADVLNIVKRDYPQYAWSKPTLKRRLGFFSIRYIDTSVRPEELGEAVATELVNVGGDLGFRAMTAKVREKYRLNVRERDVLMTLRDLDPQGVERRGDVGKKKEKKRKETFVSLVSRFSFIDIDYNPV